MIELRPYLPGDAAMMQKVQPCMGELTDELKALMAGGDPDGIKWTAWHEDVPVLIGGVFPLWAGRSTAWLIIGEIPPFGWFDIARKIRAVLKEDPSVRIEATALASDPKAQKFLEWLGFAREGLMRHYGPDGADHIGYARISDHQGGLI